MLDDGHGSRDVGRWPGSHRRTLAVTAVWPIGLTLACVACLLADSGAAWLGGALIVAWFVVLDRTLGLPPRSWLPTIVRWWLPVSVLVVAATLVPPRARSGGWISPAVLAEGVVLLALLVVGIFSRLGDRGISPAPVMAFPLREGRWRVAEGGGPALNHHWRVRAQRGALDLVRIGGNGMSHHGAPHRVDDFFAYGTPVFSPCDGAVVASIDGQDDSPGAGAHRAGNHPAGNHVVLAVDGVQVVLAHFARGTVLVAIGEQVQVGQQLARVGNSGNSTEPHLHIHAQRGAAPLRLRFPGGRHHFQRGSTITA